MKRTFLFVMLLSTAGLFACDSESAEYPGSDAVHQADTIGDAASQDLLIPVFDVEQDDAGNADVDTASDPDGGSDVQNCPSSYVQLPVALGLLSSYSRAESHPSIRQWSDRARSTGYKGLVFTDRVNLSPGASALDRLSDADPDDALLEIFHFDAEYDDFFTQGEGASAGVVDESQERDLVTAPGLALQSVVGGQATASYESLTGFDFDRQDTRLRLRLKVPQKTSPSRVLVNLGFGTQHNQNDLRWVLSWAGDPGDGDMTGDGYLADPNAGGAFTDYDLDLRDQIRSSVDPYVWQEGALWRVDFIAEGASRTVVDEVRLFSDAFYVDQQTESEDYSDSRVALLSGIEFQLDDGVRSHCIAPDRFPTLGVLTTAALLQDMNRAGCWTVAPTLDDALQHDFEAVEVWTDDGVDESGWDLLLRQRGPVTAVAAARPEVERDLDDTLPHNRVLAETVSSDEIMAAFRAGRSYMTDHLDVSAEFWAEQQDCARVELGETVEQDGVLHVKVTCPGGIDIVELVNVSADGETSRQEVAGAALGAELPLADLTDGYVRLVARCAAGESLYTNPIWLDRP